MVTSSYKLYVAELNLSRKGHWTRTQGNIRSIAYSANGKYLASGFLDGHIEVLRTGKWTQAFARLYGHTDRVNCLDFSKNPRVLSSGSTDGSVRLRNVLKGQIFGVARVGSAIWKTALSPLWQQIVSCSYGGVLQMWNVAMMQSSSQDAEVQREVRLRMFALSGNGKRVLFLTKEHSLELYSTLDGAKIWHSYVTCIGLDHHGRQAALGDIDGTFQIWNLQKFTCNRERVERTSRELKAQFDVFRSVSMAQKLC